MMLATQKTRCTTVSLSGIPVIHLVFFYLCFTAAAIEVSTRL